MASLLLAMDLGYWSDQPISIDQPSGPRPAGPLSAFFAKAPTEHPIKRVGRSWIGLQDLAPQTQEPANEEEEEELGESDAEAEHEEVRQSLSDISELVAKLTSKLDEAQGRGAKARKLSVPIDVLLRAKRLLQDPEGAQRQTEEDIARE